MHWLPAIIDLIVTMQRSHARELPTYMHLLVLRGARQLLWGSAPRLLLG